MTGQQYGPILTFAMPIDDSGPPLLWKVEMPPNPLIAVETYTMLDGFLDTNDTHHSPTHIYINGYQSWSFSGSVVQGDKQPQSAMHDVFSRAFNHGGYAAPKATYEPETKMTAGRTITMSVHQSIKLISLHVLPQMEVHRPKI